MVPQEPSTEKQLYTGGGASHHWIRGLAGQRLTDRCLLSGGIDGVLSLLEQEERFRPEEHALIGANLPRTWLAEEFPELVIESELPLTEFYRDRSDYRASPFQRFRSDLLDYPYFALMGVVGCMAIVNMVLKFLGRATTDLLPVAIILGIAGAILLKVTERRAPPRLFRIAGLMRAMLTADNEELRTTMITGRDLVLTLLQLHLAHFPPRAQRRWWPWVVMSVLALLYVLYFLRAGYDPWMQHGFALVVFLWFLSAVFTSRMHPRERAWARTFGDLYRFAVSGSTFSRLPKRAEREAILQYLASSPGSISSPGFLALLSVPICATIVILANDPVRMLIAWIAILAATAILRIAMVPNLSTTARERLWVRLFMEQLDDCIAANRTVEISPN